jgi:hypothetical protein
MKRNVLLAVLLSAISAISVAAQAATLIVTPDASTYQVGEIITLHVVGDPQGGSARGIWGRLLFSEALANHWIAPTQSTHTIAGVGPARVGPLDQYNNSYSQYSYGFSDAFNQLFGEVPTSVEQSTISVIRLKARREGTLSFFWEEQADGHGNQLTYFDATPPRPAATVTIVPEPRAAVPIALAFLGLLASPRRSADQSRTTATSARTLPSSARP